MTSKYRLYYNSDGTPKYYSMEELEGTFIYVDQQTFQNCRYDIIVVKGVIKSLSENTISRYNQVDQETSTTVRTDPTDILLVVGQSNRYILWDYTFSI
jgi:capsule polysaccharide export protein KpsC/LpsZ